MKRKTLDVTINFQDGEEIECDLTRPSKDAKNAVADWMLGMHTQRKMSVLEILMLIAREPRDVSNWSTVNAPTIAKMSAVGWIKLDPTTRKWSITNTGKSALEGK